MDTIKVNIQKEAFHFWNALKIYYLHPNSINKQVLFSEDVLIAELQSSLSMEKCLVLYRNICMKLFNECGVKKSELYTAELSDLKILEVSTEAVNNVFSLSNKMFLLIRKLLPKVNVDSSFQFFEFMFLDKVALKVYIFTKCIQISGEENCSLVSDKQQNPLAVLKFNYLELNLSPECLVISYDKGLSEKGITWLHATFITRFKKLLSKNDSKEMINKKENKLQIDNQVDVVQYYKFYEELKSKYAKYLIQNWTESTDPKKFVYEDIGIATYLMMLWNDGNIPEKNSKKQKFVDLGCGNGLLVHILNSEGHFGIGLDIRKRKIWDTYPSTTLLKEETIIPGIRTTYPEADWLIGNHSDELTAWVPIMARLSNNHCQYFVLPCCPYELNGMKFRRKNSNFSSYHDFINYIKNISELCRFDTFVDKLRIPSTKKISLIGLRRAEDLKEGSVLVNNEIIKFINEECQSFDKNKNKISSDDQNLNSQTTLNFKVRDSVEPVRNCTRLSKGFVENTLKIIMNELLKEHVYCPVMKNGKPSTWNRGRKLSIRELASCLDENLLKQLKNECKGLQTLLKNNHFLFEVYQGCVQFRSPESLLQLCNKFLESQSDKWKLKKCWFYNNHPDQCPLGDDVCSYSHSK